MKKLLYFSPVFWASYKQRPHFFIQHFLEKGYEVLWVEPYAVRLPRWQDLKFKEHRCVATSLLPPGLSLIKLPVLPLEPLPFLSKINDLIGQKIIKQMKAWLTPGALLGLGKPSLIALNVLMQHQGPSFYDAMDDFPEFHTGISRWRLAHTEEKIAQRVQTILVSATILEKKYANLKTKVHKIYNAFDDQTIIFAPFSQKNSKVIGYIGTIGKWFDWDIVLRIAKKFPQWTLELIGPCFGALPKDLPSNIKMLGAVSHNTVQSHMSRFRMGLIPFKKYSLTNSIDPIKYYEYRALGLPVVSTDFGEMRYRAQDAGVFLINQQQVEEGIILAASYQEPLIDNENFYKLNHWKQRLGMLDTFIHANFRDFM